MEDMAATTKRHPSRTRHRTAVSKEGKILGGEIEFTIDGGAYATLSSVVLSRGTIHAGGPYFWPSVRIRTKAVATEYASPWGVSRIWRAAELICDGAAHGPHRRGRGNFSGRNSPEKFSEAGGRRRPRNRPFEKKLIWIVCSAGRWNFPAMPRRKRALRKKTRTDRSPKKGIGIAAFLHGAGFTAPGRTLSEFAGRCGKPMPTARFECWCPARNLAREQIRCFARSRRRRWVCRMKVSRSRSGHDGGSEQRSDRGNRERR